MAGVQTNDDRYRKMATFTLCEETRKTLIALAKHHGTNRSRIIDAMVRYFAAKPDLLDLSEEETSEAPKPAKSHAGGKKAARRPPQA